MELLEYKVYRNQSELVAAFMRETDAHIFIETMKICDDWRIVKNGNIIYDTENEM